MEEQSKRGSELSVLTLAFGSNSALLVGGFTDWAGSLEEIAGIRTLRPKQAWLVVNLSVTIASGFSPVKCLL